MLRAQSISLREPCSFADLKRVPVGLGCTGDPTIAPAIVGRSGVPAEECSENGPCAKNRK